MFDFLAFADQAVVSSKLIEYANQQCGLPAVAAICPAGKRLSEAPELEVRFG